MRAVTIRNLLIVFGALVVSGTPATCEEQSKHPPETRQVIATGEAPAGDPNAFDLAKARALQAAVEQGIGVFVSSVTIGENYRVIKQEILTKADGYALLDEVLSRSVSDGFLKVTIKATVSSVPLAERLKKLGLLNDWKVAVMVTEHYTPRRQQVPDPAAETAIKQKIKEAGFRLINEKRRKELIERGLAERVASEDPAKRKAALAAIAREYDVDIVVEGEAFADYITEKDRGGLNNYLVRGRIEVTAYYTDTAEELSITEAFGDGVDLSENLAFKQCCKSLGLQVGDQIAKDLLIAPLAPVISVKIKNFPSQSVACSFGNALKQLPGVTRVAEHRYNSGTQAWDVYIDSNFRDLLARKIEWCPAGKKLGIRIDNSSKTHIEGRVTKPLPA